MKNRTNEKKRDHKKVGADVKNSIVRFNNLFILRKRHKSVALR